MRIAKLLVLSALWLVGLSANAADLIERTAPEQPDWYVDVDALDKTPCEFKAGEVYVLYNVGTGMYFYHGNAWGSQASGSFEAAIPLRFILPDGKTMEDKQLYLRDYDDRDNQYKWRTAFVTVGDGHVNGVYGNGTAAVFIDNNDGPAALLWVEAVGDKTYRISISEENSVAKPEGLFFGIDPEGAAVDNGEMGTCIMPKLAEELNTEWQFFAAPAEMGEYFKLYDVYQAAEALKKTIEQAEAKGISVSSAAAVYNNEASTIEQINEAAKVLTDAMSNAIAGGTAENPTDATSMIVNPDFDNASNEGWSGNKPGMTGDGNHGPANVAEFWQTSNFDTYQELSGLPAGIYRLTMYGFYRSGGPAEAYPNYVDGKNYIVNLYATANGETLKTDIMNPYAILNKTSFAGPTAWGTNAAEAGSNGYLIPNDPSCARVYFDKGWYLNSLFFIVGEDGAARIGVKKDGDAISNDWIPFDEFRLTYYGNSGASYQKWVELSVPQFSDDVLCTKAVMDAYKAVAAEQKATSKEEAYAAIEVLTKEAAKVQANISLWNTWKKTIEDAYAKYATDQVYGNLDATGYLVDYYADDINPDGGPGMETLMTELALTDEELEAEIALVNSMIENIEKEAAEGIKEGDDMTYLLTNPKFETGDFTGWTYKEGKLGNKNVECFQSVVDVWQEKSDMKPGVYSISVQAFERPGGNGSFTGDEASKVYLYMNNAKVPVQNIVKGAIPVDQAVPVPLDLNADGTVAKVNYGAEGANCYLDAQGGTSGWPYDYEQAEAGYIPNSVDGARIAFEANRYWQQCYGLVGEDGKMKIGLTSNGQKVEWVLFANFKLIYEGYNVATVEPALDEALKGISLDKHMGKDVYNMAKGLKDRAEEAKATGNGKTMFQMLSEVYDASDAITKSEQLFATLDNAIDPENEFCLQNVIVTSANEQAKTEANALVANLRNGIDNYEFNDDEVAGLLEQIEQMKTKLRLPSSYDNASDDNKIDFTGVIVNPDYVNPETDLSYGDGWTNAGNPGNDDTQKGAQAMEFWQSTIDMYQDIQGLPKGTYIVQVDAWCRTGSNAECLAAYQLDPDSTLAYVYALGEDNTTFVTPMANLMKGAQTEDPYYDGIVAETINGTEYYLPNSLVGGKYYMDPDAIPANEGIYTNKVIAKVGDDGKLRIGIKKETAPGNSWVVCDSWRLYYCGTNSQLTPSPDITGVETVEGVETSKVEFFTLDGRKATRAQKGVIIQKTTLGNGATIIKKIMK